MLPGVSGGAVVSALVASDMALIGYVCTIPAVPLSLNVYTRMHWAAKARAREAFQEQVWAVLNEKDNRCPRHLDFIECKAVLMFKKNRRRDGENFGAVLWKWAADTLVREGVIPDDTPEHILCHTPKIVVGDIEETLLIVQASAALDIMEGIEEAGRVGAPRPWQTPSKRGLHV